jgi:hypothetical protein
MTKFALLHLVQMDTTEEPAVAAPELIDVNDAGVD